MVTFTDDFDRANVDLDGDNGWVVREQGGSAGDPQIAIFSRYARLAATEQAVAIQTATANVPTTRAQEVRVVCTSTVQSSTSRLQAISFGVGAVNAAWAARRLGTWATLEYRASGERRLSIWSDQIGTVGTAVEIASRTLVASGSVVQTGFSGRLHDDGALDTLQGLRLIVDQVDGGTRARAYVNALDDDEPTLEVLIASDWYAHSGATEYGSPWFGFSDVTSDSQVTPTVNSLRVTEFTAFDYVHERVEATQFEDNPSLQELRDLVKRRHSRALNTSIDDLTIDEALNDAIDELVNTAGDTAWFLRRSEQLTLNTDTEFLVELPRHIRRLLTLERIPARGECHWRFMYFTTDGGLVIRILPYSESSGTFRASYVLKHVHLSHNDDRSPIPREHREIVVVSAALRLAEADRSSATYQQLVARFGALRALFMRDLNRNTQKERKVMTPMRRGMRRPFRTRYWFPT